VKRTGENGFTLVEFAIGLVVLGLLVGIGMQMVGPLTVRMKTTETKEGVNADIEAVIGYGSTNLRIPDLVTNPFASVVRTATDTWAKPIQYIFDSNLTTAGSVCSRTTATITVRVCSDAACVTFTDIRNVAFLVASSGGNYTNQTGTSTGYAAATTIRTYAPGLTVGGNPYDDIVKWVTLPELQTKIGCGTMAYEVWNSGALAYFRVNGGTACIPVQNNGVISSLILGGTINGFTDVGCTVSENPSSIAFSEAATIDTDGNHRINYNKTNR
jgi:prepilin-type N-terminal cleavage/methylation domain-containing protein